MQFQRLGKREEELLRTLQDINLSKQTEREESGTHVSEILNRWAWEEGHIPSNLMTATDAEALGFDPLLRFETGYAWEEIIGREVFRKTQPLEIIVPTEPIERDGILLTPDGIDRENRTVYEYKATWKGWHTYELETAWRWIWQGMAYCYALGYNTLILQVFHVNGNWSPPSPDVRFGQFDFTDEELESHWQEVLERS